MVSDRKIENFIDTLITIKKPVEKNYFHQTFFFITTVQVKLLFYQL